MFADTNESVTFYEVVNVFKVSLHDATLVPKTCEKAFRNRQHCIVGQKRFRLTVTERRK